MQRATVTDLIAFLAVARERNFTRAAAQLGVSFGVQSGPGRYRRKYLNKHGDCAQGCGPDWTPIKSP